MIRYTLACRLPRQDVLYNIILTGSLTSWLFLYAQALQALEKGQGLLDGDPSTSGAEPQVVGERIKSGSTPQPNLLPPEIADSLSASLDRQRLQLYELLVEIASVSACMYLFSFLCSIRNFLKLY